MTNNNNYPTKDEYLQNIRDIQANELKTERFKNACATLSACY